MMKLWNRMRRKLAFLLLLSLLAIGNPLPFSARMRGLLVASVDVMRGHYQVLQTGLPMNLASLWLLKKRYGIETRLLGCVVNDSLLAYVDGYNTVSVAAIQHQFGRDVFQKAEEAVRVWVMRPDAMITPEGPNIRY